MTTVTIRADDAEVCGQFKRLVIGRPAATKGARRRRQTLCVHVTLEGCDEDIERELLAFQQAVCSADPV